MTENSSFTRLFFGLGKWFSMFFAMLSLAGVVLGGIYWGVSYVGGGLNVPEFSDEEIQGQVMNRGSRSGINSQQTKLELTNKYGQEILAIIGRHGVAGMDTDAVINQMMDIPENRRDKFVPGLQRFMEDGLGQMRREGRMSDQVPFELMMTYINAFDRAVGEEQSSETKNTYERAAMLAAIVFGMGMFILAITLPVLVKIEKNTRGNGGMFEKSANAPSARPASVRQTIDPISPARKCQKCEATLGANDAFCNECGQPIT